MIETNRKELLEAARLGHWMLNLAITFQWLVRLWSSYACMSSPNLNLGFRILDKMWRWHFYQLNQLLLLPLRLNDVLNARRAASFVWAPESLQLCTGEKLAGLHSQEAWPRALRPKHPQPLCWEFWEQLPLLIITQLIATAGAYWIHTTGTGSGFIPVLPWEAPEYHWELRTTSVMGLKTGERGFLGTEWSTWNIMALKLTKELKMELSDYPAVPL